MDSELALVMLEVDLLDAANPDSEALPQFVEAVVAAAGTQKGYSGFAWEAGAKLFDIAKRLDQDPNCLFDKCGWPALAIGLRTALQDDRLLSAFSYASVPFLPPSDSPPIFEHPHIVEAIRAGLAANPHPFIKPSELGIADPAVQTQFGELLSRLRHFSVDSEVLLQWSASALRVLPAQSTGHQVAATSLLQALYSERRFAMAYYAFRALAERHGDLWQQPLALSILQAFIDQCWQDEEIGVETLNHLCTDDDLLRRSSEHFDLLALVGALGINLTRRGYTEAESVAWRFVNEIYGSHQLVACALGDYLTDGDLPPLPVFETDQLESLERESHQAVKSAETQLRARRYELPLATKIYQSNVREVFIPFLDEIRSGRCSYALVERIQEIDPVELINESEWQKTSRYPVEGKMLRKMIGDNSRILQALETATRKRIELDQVRAELTERSHDEFELFQEFDLLLEDRSAVVTWALGTMLPDLWTRLQEGVTIAAREQGARRYGAR